MVIVKGHEVLNLTVVMIVHSCEYTKNNIKFCTLNEYMDYISIKLFKKVITLQITKNDQKSHYDQM